jgi:uncharacterized repeat protein (TIGR04042 family)
MPEIIFTVQLPDGRTKECYSPSTVILQHFQQGEEMSVAEFVSRSRKAFPAASERVRAKFGFGCTSAASQLANIEEWARSYASDATIRILHI